MSIKLRDYQKEAVSKALLHLSQNSRSLIALPTGTGKTVIMSNLIKKYGKKTLVVVHTRELVEQFIKTYQQVFSKEHVGQCNSVLREDSQVIIATIQSLQYKGNYEYLRTLGIELLIFDECHHVAAKSYLNLINNLDFQKKAICGFTATPYRTDRKDITKILGLISYKVSIIDMIENGYLSDIKGYRIYTNISLSGVRRNKGDFQLNTLAAVVNVKNRNELILKHYKETSLNEKSICFAVNVKHAEDLCSIFKNNGIKSEVIHGRLKKHIRDQIIKDFKSGYVKVLFNCNILTEGFDDPSITSILMARPTCSKTLYVQMVGRGCRPYPNKPFCKILEFTDNHFDLCSFEDLLDSPNKKIKIKESESLTEYSRRVLLELEVEGEGTVHEEIHLIPKIIHERPATAWQLMKLKQLNISFLEGITESMANKLINTGR